MWRPTRAEVEAINRMLYEELQAVRDRLNALLEDDGEESGAGNTTTEGEETP